VYGLVFEQLHIHIQYKPWEQRWRQKDKVRTKEATRGGLFYTGYRNGRSPYSESSSEPKKQKRARISTLSRVCRKIYGETALYPFTVHTFFFSNAWVAREWLATLKPVQKRAIRQLHPTFLTEHTIRKPFERPGGCTCPSEPVG